MMRRQRQDDEEEEEEDPQSRAINELSSILLNLLRSPAPFTDHPPYPRRIRAAGQITPAGLACLLLGVSVALMLCGSVTFIIGFLMMPWVLGLVTVVYLAGVVSAVCLVWKSLVWYASPHPPSVPRKDVNVPAWKLL